MSRKIRVGFFFSSLHRAKKTNSINNLTQYEKNYPVKSVRKWFMEFTEYVAGCCNSHIYNLWCRILQYSISQFVLVSGSNSIKIHALGSFSQVCFTVILELWRLHLRNLLGSFKSIQRTSETAIPSFVPSVYVPSDLCHPRSRQDMSEGALGDTQWCHPQEISGRTWHFTRLALLPWAHQQLCKNKQAIRIRHKSTQWHCRFSCIIKADFSALSDVYLCYSAIHK